MRDGDNPDAPTGNDVGAGSAQSIDRAPGPSVPDVAVLGDPEPASVHVIVAGERTRIVISGEIDADLMPDLLEAAADAEMTGLPIEVDAQHVTFMDSSGIAFLARLASRSAERVRILRAPDAVRFLLEVTRIGELLDLIDEESPAPARQIAAPEGRPAPPEPDGAA